MDATKRERLEKAGFKVGTVAEFLGLTPAESALVEARLALSKALKLRRQSQNLSQAALARRIKSSQSRVAKIESGDPSVSLDLMVRAFFETGASTEELAGVIVSTRIEPSRPSNGNLSLPVASASGASTRRRRT